MFDDDDDFQQERAEDCDPLIRKDEHIVHSALRKSGAESDRVLKGSNPTRIKLDMSDSGYGSEIGTPGMDVYQVPNDERRGGSSPDRLDGWKPERGVKYCLQLYCQRPGVCSRGRQEEGSGTCYGNTKASQLVIDHRSYF